MKLRCFSKRLFFGLTLVALLTLTGCQKSSKEETSEVASTQLVLTETKPDSVMTEMNLSLEREAVLARVRTIYDYIERESTVLGGSVDDDFLDRVFCTKSWNRLIMAVRQKEYKTNTLFFEINHWTMSQESLSFVDFDEFEVVDCEVKSPKERTATVNFTVYAANTYTPARIDLVYEDGEWKINNFYQLKYMLNVRESMWRYLDDEILFLI